MSSPLTVAICTLGSHPRLRDCVNAVIGQTRSDIEIIVVDNAPGAARLDTALAGIADPRLRVIAEGRPGLSWARNAALAHCRTDLIAFTDDDAIAEPAWADALMRPFDDPEVVAVTGVVLPAELRTVAQGMFEEYVGFGKGNEEVRWSWRDGSTSSGGPVRPGPLFPYTTGSVGSGNNMAFRAATLRSHGGFDVVLGAGTPTRGGEDLDAFSRLLLAGDAIVYTPHARVRHYHRETLVALRQQIFGQGSGMGAVLAKSIRRDPRLVATVLRSSLRVARRALGRRGRASGSTRGPAATEAGAAAASSPTVAAGRARAHRRLVLTEIAGLAASPVLYWRSSRAAGLHGDGDGAGLSRSGR